MTKTSGPPDNQNPEGGFAARLARKLLPWIVLITIFWLIFSREPLDKVLAEFGRLTLMQIILLSVLSLIAVAGVAVLDGTAMWYGFSRLEVKIEWKEMALVRSAMMLLASIATLIGQAGLAAHVARKHKISAGAATGMVMFLFLVEIYGMITVATIGLPAYLLVKGGGAGPSAPVELAVLMVTPAWMALTVFIMVVRSGRGAGVLERLRLTPLVQPFQAMRPVEFAKILALKTLLAAWQVGITIPAFLIYGKWIPALDMYAFMPLAILVSSIPVTPARLGTTQVSWVAFFQHLVQPEALVAFSLLLQFLLNVCRWLIGAAALPFIYGDIIKGRRDGQL